MTTDSQIIREFLRLTRKKPPAIQREARAIVHKIKHPMEEILSKVAADSIAERARRLHVSRQTIYVWMSERFRPTRGQAELISEMSDVPIEHIVDDGFEVKNDAGKQTGKKAEPMAAGRGQAAKRVDRDEPRRRGKVDAGGRNEPA